MLPSTFPTPSSNCVKDSPECKDTALEEIVFDEQESYSQQYMAADFTTDGDLDVGFFAAGVFCKPL